MKNVYIPCDIPPTHHKTFQENYEIITKKTDRLFLFAADHKLEHLNPIAPKIFFELAQKSEIGAFATHLGLISRYGKQYPDINYIVKLNGKSNALHNHDPISQQLWSVNDVITFQKNSGLKIRGVGYTIYLGSEHESVMLAQAAQIVFQAHQQGLVVILWIYPRGTSIKNDTDAHLIAGAAGVAASLGADFIKLKLPHKTEHLSTEQVIEFIMKSAGTTKVLFSGGERQEPQHFLKEVAIQIAAGAAGVAVGRNIYEQDADEAHSMIKKLHTLIYEK
jgi:fructose-bisphosphate aldolase/6-deoxy-5-ketofructose 1-phosphate synthase